MGGIADGGWERRLGWPDDGTITTDDLVGALPPELPFRGRAFKRLLMSPLPGRIAVMYLCKDFFACAPQSWYQLALLAREYGAVAQFLTGEGHEHLRGSMVFERAPRERLPDLVREQLAAFYAHLERHVEEELARGCRVGESSEVPR